MNDECIEEKLVVFTDESEEIRSNLKYIELETKLIELTEIVKQTQRIIESQNLNQVETLVSDIANNIDQAHSELEQAHIVSGMMTYVTLGAMAGTLAGTIVGFFPGVIIGSASGFIYWFKK